MSEFYSESGEYMRQKVAGMVRSLLVDPNVEIVGRSDTSFLEALELYESRLDKGYSLTDCISMNVCREAGITDVITTDKHFQQEGFGIILGLT
jgi:predicted nucleic acid-binding protein